MTTTSASTTLERKPTEPVTIAALIDSPAYKDRFRQVLGERASQFLCSVLTAVNGSGLKNVDPQSVLAAAMVAATLDLPIEKNLGYAHIVPYKGRAQFQMGYKGYIQLAQRTGQYACINDVVIPAGVLIKFDRIKGELTLDWDKADEDELPAGYVCYFRLLNGFEKTVFWTHREIEQHAKRYAPSYFDEDSAWQKNFDSMALKTVIKAALSKYGILSVQLCRALEHDAVEVPPASGNGLNTGMPIPEIGGKEEGEPEILDFQSGTTGGEASSNTAQPEGSIPDASPAAGKPFNNGDGARGKPSPLSGVLRQIMSVDNITDAELLVALKKEKPGTRTPENLDVLSGEKLQGIIRNFGNLRDRVLAARRTVK